MSIEAMKQALEALEMGLGQVDGDYDTAIQKAIGAVTALRIAIAEAEKQEPVAQDIQEKCRIEVVPAKGGLLPAAPAAPVQDDLAYREAVSLATWLFKKHFAGEEHYASGRVVWEPCDTTAGVISQIDNMVCGLVQPAAPVQESNWKNAAIRLGEELSSVGPDGYYDMTAEQWLDWSMDQQPRGKNSLPATQRQWVSLTDEEIMEVNGIHDDPEEWPEVISEARAIEQRLKEKNTGETK